ncbi:hypothetical protein FOMPIDRAFT_1144306 [Fomitopsis schrenkii]|uniref:Uncharacterized protein n=1 Tax=Fomitopsis schrenkii TaxID=2126942 RepID=S8FKV6_FOMSC|nr:hypothetical protein FOMPIDRAFT_1144306 [Fomitopsis schrenkii]
MWLLPSVVFLTALLVGPQPATGLTAANFAGNIFREVKGIAGKAGHGAKEIAGKVEHEVGQAIHDITTETPQDFWGRAISLGQKLSDYATKLVEDTAKDVEPTIRVKMNHVVTTMHVIVSDTEDLKNSIAQAHGASLDDIKNGIEKIFDDLMEELKKQFPPTDQAPNHAQRRGNVSLVLHRVEDAFVKLCVQHGMSEDQLRVHLDPIMRHVETIVVTLGDLAEQHPVLFEVLVISGIMLVVPESWFLRPLFRMFGMAPEGPVAGSAVAWAQRRFYGAYIPKGSWFSHLQRAGMTRWANPIWKAIGGSVLAGIGLAGSLFSGCGR